MKNLRKLYFVIKWVSLAVSIILFCYIPSVNDKYEAVNDEKYAIISVRFASQDLIDTYKKTSEDVVTIIEKYKLVSVDSSIEQEVNIEYMFQDVIKINNEMKSAEDRLIKAIEATRSEEIHKFVYTRFYIKHDFQSFNELASDFADFSSYRASTLSELEGLNELVSQKISESNNKIDSLINTNIILYSVSTVLLIVFLALSFKKYKKWIRLILACGSIAAAIAGFISVVIIRTGIENPNTKYEYIDQYFDSTREFERIYLSAVMYNTEKGENTKYLDNTKVEFEKLKATYRDIANNTSNEKLKTVIQSKLKVMDDLELELNYENRVEARYFVKLSEPKTISLALEMNKEYFKVHDLLYTNEVGYNKDFFESYLSDYDTIYNVEKNINKSIYILICVNIVFVIGMKVYSDTYKKKKN